MRVITLNVNGIRSAAKKGLFDWLPRQQADIVCLQEVKAQETDLTEEIRAPKGFHGFFSCAEKKGYAGVTLYSRRQPDKLRVGFGSKEHDDEGRYLQADFGKLSVVSIYLPSGSAGPHRQESKYRFMDKFYPVLKKLRNDGREYILCGDWNIAHKEIDLKNWKSNQKNSGFLPEERAWLTKAFDELGWVDVFRTLNHKPDQYTWWSNRGQAYAKNVGWRIDYQIATPAIAKKAKKERIYNDKRFSDHAPLILDYDHTL
ncbi:MAG: exodeoxyribonuclease III [Candidatus Muproteobacteria bacterium RIFCSPHIGHO2_12_FULL_60_33]|uniref:Exodeoxyribonuclease III n=1 Tax=Candidatus Muproteobacteria bacterium RIFCSPLOWO2_01_FULL_60_18 TaxID=1817768 RepID=A0A1F6U3P3_9PROT|nr:MAG: exodeoxyribonuclease III [Candidatus Muproteobacteria bacterium RIFCSPLOWO2_01_FULL_60_18]OGI54086.1 MAG: exodeoxyribonuclease III [Candidatus Muproteobacteria bacterium RIFCSPHIGHO2_02_FULL_60_13]OGI54958.1 MAG: exodeoxyribonuclease III [Candidatus Muproteobacteria bacterium RIFCSPHIGHO2_12_FULL_60_33]